MKLDNVNYFEKLKETFSKKRLILTTFIAVVALISYAYDRMNILQVDYSEGIASARYALIDLTEKNTGSYSSLFSVFGNMFIPISFWNIFYSRIFPFKKNNVLFIINVLVVVISSILFGGRTNVLILILIFIATSRPIQRSTSYIRTILLCCLIILLFFFVGYVFYDRAEANNVNPAFYLNTMVSWQRGFIDRNVIFSLNSDSLIAVYTSIILMIISYFIHSLWVFASTIGTNTFGTAMFANYQTIFYKLGLTNTLPSDTSYGGVFLSLPGAVNYQFGVIGLLLSPLIICLIQYILIKLSVINGPLGRISLFIYFSLSLTMLASPFIIITDVYMFPGLLFCGGFVALLFKKQKAYEDRIS